MVIPCLIIEDDRDTRESLEVVLNNFGYQTQCAMCRDSVLKLLKYGSAELILMDVHMPGCPVVPFLDALAAHLPKPKVIAISCDYTVLRDLAPFVDGCLKKPIDPDDLEQLLRVLGERPGESQRTSVKSQDSARWR